MGAQSVWGFSAAWQPGVDMKFILRPQKGLYKENQPFTIMIVSSLKQN